MFGVPAYGMIEVMFADYAIACAVFLVTLIIGTLLVRLPIIRKSYLPAKPEPELRAGQRLLWF